MTTTTTQTLGIPVKRLVIILVAAALAVTAIVASQRTTSSLEATESVTQRSDSSGLTQAFDAGKFDAGLTSIPSTAATGSVAIPQVLVVEGEGGLYDALIAGKFDVDFGNNATGLRYVADPKLTTNESGLWAAFASGQLDEGHSDTGSAPQPAAPVSHTATISGGHLK